MNCTPFHFPQRGKGFDTPSPLGEGWEGVIDKGEKESIFSMRSRCVKFIALDKKMCSIYANII